MRAPRRQSLRALSAPNGSAGGRGDSFIDPAALMRIEGLELRARLAVEGFLSGLHRSQRHGFSVEFSEYRAYSQGDDPRYVDWRLMARSDRYYVKRFEDETNQRCWLMVDLSRSMDFGSLGYTKADYARTLAATLAYFLSGQRDAVGLITFDERVADYLPARHRPGHLRRLMLHLERAAGGRSTDLGAALEHVAATVQKRGLVALISDLLIPPDVLAGKLGLLRSRGHDVIVLRVLDPAEAAFPFEKPGLFIDAETGQRLYVDPDTAREAYLRRFAEHAAALAKTCAELGVDLETATTDRPLAGALFDFLRARMRRGRSIQRAAPRARSRA